jgi:hypothetical protein
MAFSRLGCTYGLKDSSNTLKVLNDLAACILGTG